MFFDIKHEKECEYLARLIATAPDLLVNGDQLNILVEKARGIIELLPQIGGEETVNYLALKDGALRNQS